MLNETRRRTHLKRKVLSRKLAFPAKVQTSRKRSPGAGDFGAGLEIFDYPCGQRLEPVLRQELERLLKARESHCSDEVAGKLGRISAKMINRLLARFIFLRSRSTSLFSVICFVIVFPFRRVVRS